MEDEGLYGRLNVQPDRQLLIQRANKIKQEMVLYRNREKHKLRKDVKILRENINSEANNTRILLDLFPEEIWIMILQKINSTEDRMHCMKTCVLLDRLLQNWKPTLVFDKVFPKFHKYLSRSDYLNLRRVCQDWQKNIDTFFENPLINDLPTKSDSFARWDRLSEKPYSCFQYDFRDLSKNKQRAISAVTHSKNPFIGRAASLEIIQPQPKLSRPFNTFLRKFGAYIWHLKLEYGSDCSSVQENSPSFCLSSCMEFIKGFQNLKSFCFSDEFQPFSDCDSYGDDSDDDVEVIPEDPKLLEIPYPNHKYLESLTFDSERKQLSKVVDKLVQKYSNQLKYLYVRSWTSELYQTLTWNSLQQLRLNVSEWPNKLFQSLCKLQAPKLHKLCLESNNDENKKLGNMLRVIKSVPSLVSLELSFCDSGNGFQNYQNIEVLEVEEEFGFCEGIKEVTVISEFDVELDFLIFFPLVKRLTVTHNESESRGLIDMMHWSQKVSYQENDFTLMYKSNIWEILPHLQLLEDARKGRSCPSQVYTRLGFEAKLTQREICDKIFQVARKTANYQNLKRLTEERKELKKELTILRQVISTYCKTGGKQRKITSSQVLEFVLPFLTTSQTLFCRTICQNWRSAIDNFLVTNRSNLRTEQITHVFHIPTLDIEDGKITDMKRMTPLNPFVGRSVVVELNQTVKAELHNKVWLQAEQSQFKNLIEAFGAHIWHLEISGGKEGACVRKREFYEIIILFVLEQCTNLRTLTLSNIRIEWNSACEIFLHSELPDHMYLQKLDFGVIDYLGVDEQNVLFTKFHQQLTSLKGDDLRFYSSNKGLCWRNLAEFEMSSIYGTESVRGPRRARPSFDQLLQFDAPNLRRLSLSVVGGREELTNLILLTRHFSNLTTLALKFPKEPLNCSAGEMAGMTPGLISSTKLVCMETTVSGKTTCYDFLHFFPYIRKLVVCEVFNIVKKEYENDKHEFLNVTLTRLVSVKNKKLDKKTKTPDVLSMKFASYLPEICDNQSGNTSTNACKSVWEILPLLNRVEMTKKHIFKDAEVSKQKVFFRK